MGLSEQKQRPSPRRLAAPNSRTRTTVVRAAVTHVYLVSLFALGCSAEALLTLGKGVTRDAGSDESTAAGETSDGAVPEVDASQTEPVSETSHESEASTDVAESTTTNGPTSSQPQTTESVVSESGNTDATTDAGTPSSLPVYEFLEPQLVEELFSGAKDDNPTLTWDMTEIYFSSKRDEGDTNLWWAHRASVDEPFSAPELLVEWSSAGFDTSPAIEGDGLTFWFSSVREEGIGGLDIFRVQRPSRSQPWGPIQAVTELNSDSDDIPRPTGAEELIMPLASRRAGGDYLTYFARREAPNEPFTSMELAVGLVGDGMLVADAFLTRDGLAMLYTQAAEGEPGDLYVATRRSLREAFSNARAITSLNTAADERDPWLSPDGNTLYFSSDRDGTLAIYRAQRDADASLTEQ
jgi:hypothetical protein